MQAMQSRLDAVRARIRDAAARCGRPAEDIRLIAVSKTRPAADLREAYDAGQRAFGENYLQEALEKQDRLADLAIEWHFIGAIQSNKTRDIATRFQWAHAVSSLKHARRLSDQRPGGLPPLNVCIQVNISGEASKSGVSPEALPALGAEVAKLPRLHLRGLMALAAPTDDERLQRAAFRRVRELLEDLHTQGLDLDTLSMGMSGDLEAAVAEGATLVRIGTAIFGPRR